MEEYTSNSHKSREAIEDKTLPEKKVEAVVSAPVKTKKRGGFRKFTDVIVAEDAANVKSYIFTDVLIPAIKKAISDIFYTDAQRGVTRRRKSHIVVIMIREMTDVTTIVKESL